MIKKETTLVRYEDKTKGVEICYRTEDNSLCLSSRDKCYVDLFRQEMGPKELRQLAKKFIEIASALEKEST